DGFPVRWQLLRPLEPSELPEPERLGWRSELCSGPGNQSLHRWCLRAGHEDLRRPGWSSCNPASDSVRFLTGAKAEQPFRLAARLAFSFFARAGIHAARSEYFSPGIQCRGNTVFGTRMFRKLFFC